MASTNRFSMLSTTSHPNFPTNAPMSTSSLLAALHQAYQNGAPYILDASTTLVVNSNQADSKLVVDEALGVKVWEHARRRAEDQTIVIGTLNAHTPSLMVPVLSTFPQSTVPDILTTAISLLQCFTHALTPFSPTSEPLHHGLAVALQFSLTGSVVSATIALSTAGINTQKGLLNIPSERGYRAFDVFYYLLSAASTPAEREFLALQSPEKYALLARSGTYSPPSYLPTADDSAAADDFRANLRAIGIKGAALRGMLSVLAGLLKLGNGIGLLVDAEVVEEVCEEVAGLLGVEPEVLAKKLGDAEREALIDAVYEALIQWIISKANTAVADEFAEINRRMGEGSSSEGGDTVMVNVVELPDEKMVKALCLRSVFDDETGINSEMKYDGIEMPGVGPSVSREVKGATSDAEKEGFLGMTRDKEFAKDRKEGVVEKVGREADEDSFFHNILFPTEGQTEQQQSNKPVDINAVLASSRVWWHLSVCPTDGGSSPGTSPGIGAWSAAVVSRQIRNWRLSEWIARRAKKLDFTADFDHEEFYHRYAVLGCLEGRDGIESWIMERGWSNGEVIVGKERVWMREGAWWEAEQMLDLKPGMMPMDMGMAGYPQQQLQQNTGYFPPAALLGVNDSRDQVYGHNQNIPTPTSAAAPGGEGRGLLGGTTFNKEEAEAYQEQLDPELSKNKKIQVRTMDGIRRVWVALTWALTFWIPSFLLSSVGRMKRPDVRMAWREKVVLVFFIFLLNGMIIFWIILFARILCPEFDKVFSLDEVSGHTGRDDFWVAIHGKAYDISKFWTLQHADGNIKTTNDRMEPFAGLDLSDYFPMPLHLTCKGLEVREGQALETNETLTDPIALHKGGASTDPNSALYQKDWYTAKFLPKIDEYFKGYVVYDKKKVSDTGRGTNKPWAVYEDSVYDLTDYLYTAERYGKVNNPNVPSYHFLDDKFVDVFTNNPGMDITEMMKDVLGDMKSKERDAHIRCLKNQFFIGKVDTRKSARCQVNGIILVVFAAIITAVILVKFLAALQLGSKRKPAPQDKFVICQIPAYTEGEDQLRKALDSLTALQYDNKRKLLCVICDGLVVGGGNDRPTPNIVCDILGVDPKIDPPALPFNSVGEGSNQLNYGKVYSGLYEFEGCVVPYIVVVKVGKPSETSKPGNRGKRDSQILLLNFLNRVHHRSMMSPLELEMFHQINNVIGVDPELYEYLLMVDADTSVKPDALTRLVAACANDAKIAGICGETSLENEERSWWTMIQVYEYYISHHLSKAFESLFGSVTCLPGCFCMYRLRSADKGKPLIIADVVIQEYSDGCVDTLHKKNLLSLGEDRFLTTLMTKHFPRMSYKFIPDAYAMTAAPETWSVLLSQRRRWINSTIHNLAELVLLKEMCGFCCFSMRFVVFIDLMGTIILPATCVYIAYIIYLVASGTGALPLFSIIMIAAVYGLQAIIFIVKRQWQHIGWMIIYILAYPIYSFILPIYSFWNQDNFSWGSTRIVLGESGDKQVIAVEDEGFDPKDIPMELWDNYAIRNNLPGRRSGGGEKMFDGMNQGGIVMNEYEMDDLHSVYSSVKPASTVLTGLPMMGAPGMGYVQPPQQSPGFAMNRQSSYSAYSSMTGLPMQPHMQQGPLGSQQQLAHSRLPSMQLGGAGDYWQDGPQNNNRSSQLLSASSDNLMAMGGQRSPRGFGGLGSRPVSQIDLTRGPGSGPDDNSIVEAIRSVLREVDLDSVTKKQVRIKVEQMLQTELVGERRTFMDGKLDEILASM